MGPSDDAPEGKHDELRKEIARRLTALDARRSEGQPEDHRSEGDVCAALGSLLDALDGLEELQALDADGAIDRSD